MSEPPRIPDIAGTVIGNRAWGIARTDDGLLLASHGGAIWPARTPLSAVCHKRHRPPGENCTCGIYALTTNEGFPYYRFDGPGYAVWGQVQLWGEIVRGTKGYRAEHAYPLTLHLAHRDWRLAERLHDAYGVPVHLSNPYKEKKHGHW